MNSDLADFRKFIRRRSEAAAAYVNGDVAPLRQISTKKSPATFFGPGGGTVVGAQKVFADYARGAAAFGPGGSNQVKILQVGAADGLAFWTGLQRAKVHVRGKDQIVPMELRITEVFRREKDEWKLIHRHADMLAAKQPQKK